MDLGLHDRVYVVTGGSRGLGRATAEALVADGARVVIGARNSESLDRAVTELGKDRATGVAADLADPETPQRLVDAALSAYGRLDGGLVSVGGPPAGSVLETADEAWARAFESVFLGAVRTARTLVGALGEGGSVALVLSTSVKAPINGLAISNGLRPGLGMVVKTLADEVGPRGIRVNALLPGRVDTERVQELDASGGDPDATRRGHEQTIPLRRYGRPEEFGRVAAFLLSPAGSFVSGTMVPVDGGLHRAL
ncbi:MAG TPA: SDR family oxidoreductase [Marmoricola sp.]|nr:SDR family oxidoreductase [Marmoricola sp.]